MIGKILYNKRTIPIIFALNHDHTDFVVGKTDPPSTYLSAKDRQREEELDRQLKTAPPLPPWLAAHARRPSRVDIDVSYGSVPLQVVILILHRISMLILQLIRGYLLYIYTRTTRSFARDLMNVMNLTIGSAG